MADQQEPSTILVVDDTPENIDVLVGILKDEYQLKVAANGQRALKLAQAEPRPDLLLLDIMMPEMDGYEVCRRLKKDEATRDIPVIFVTALTEEEDEERGLSLGAVDYITKPYSPAIVKARISNHLKLYRYRKELERKNIELAQAFEELKEMEANLVQSEKMASLGTLTAGIAHELNNPINFIHSSIEGMKGIFEDMETVLQAYQGIDSKNFDAELKRIAELKENISFDELLKGLHELMDNIGLGADRAVDIVKALHTFSRLDEETKKAADLHENIEATLVILHHQLKEHIRIEKRFGKVPQVMCFPGKLNQVFINILKNAIDAIDGKSKPADDEKIVITTSTVRRQGKDYASVTFTDSGPGIPEKIKDRLFDPFFTTKEVGSGIGLGLSISQGIIQSHDGRIEIGNGETGGAEFTVLLPINGKREG